MIVGQRVVCWRVRTSGARSTVVACLAGVEALVRGASARVQR